MDEGRASEAQGAPRRQARGERRIAEILRAAASVFARDGYEGATTNAIAREAGISPGSLYQFFRNKDAVAAALTERYATELRAAQAAAFGAPASGTATSRAAVLGESGEVPDGAPLDEVVARVLAPLVAFNRENAGFKALFARTDMPPALAQATAPLHAAMEERVDALLAATAPAVDAASRRRSARVAIQIVRGMMPLVVAAPPGQAQAFETELHRAVVAYLAAALEV